MSWHRCLPVRAAAPPPPVPEQQREGRAEVQDALLRPRPTRPLLLFLIQVQAVRLLSYLAQKNDLLYDILNCQVRKGGGRGRRDAGGGFREGWVHETGFFNVLVCLRIACAVSVAASRGRQISAHKPPRGCCHHVTPILVPLREQGALLTAESSVFSPASHTVLSSTSGHRSCPCPLTMTQCLCKAVKRAQRPAETRRAGRSWPAPSPRPPRPQVHSNFLSLFQSSQPGSLLFEVLVFAERLSEGRNSTHYRAVKWHYNEQSLHEALFGDESRLADRLLSLVIHPEEEVQIQACKVIVSLQCPQDVSCRPSGCRPLPCRPSQSYFQNGE